MLFDAIARGDEQRLMTLCREHRAFIQEYAAGWLVVPDSLAQTPPPPTGTRAGCNSSRDCAPEGADRRRAAAPVGAGAHGDDAPRAAHAR
jgi:hypothetical protein